MHNYSADFERLWAAFPNDGVFGRKGAKRKAYNEFEKIKPSKSTVMAMVDAVERQLLEKNVAKEKGLFVESFPHVERWLKYERWTDEPVTFTEPLDNGRMMKNLTDRSWADHLVIDRAFTGVEK